MHAKRMVCGNDATTTVFRKVPVFKQVSTLVD